MLNYWYKHFAIDLYVEHEIDSEPLVEQDINALHVYENDDLGVGEEVVLEAIEGSNKGDVDEAYIANVRYLSDGEGDEELQAARDKLNIFR
ncbi:hypothetical protein J1N35_040768 [Gossypium stocksii]|uniref:Uncharacterized protein n=1 Tax=Gossypium stocksii TaxID=47602 RepID=A0A9D3ZI11_9ROSI|nr:hypothetical protein J1N35_040768 [Gossypium stocksii]